MLNSCQYSGDSGAAADCRPNYIRPSNPAACIHTLPPSTMRSGLKMCRILVMPMPKYRPAVSNCSSANRSPACAAWFRSRGVTASQFAVSQRHASSFVPPLPKPPAHASQCLAPMPALPMYRSTVRLLSPSKRRWSYARSQPPTLAAPTAYGCRQSPLCRYLY